MVTGGLYAFVWVYRIAADANKVAGAQVVDLRKNITATAILLCGYLASFFFGFLGFQKQMVAMQSGAAGTPMPSPLVFIGFAIGVVLLAQLIALLIRSATVFRDQAGIELPGKVGLAILTFIYCISLPLLQSRINKIEA